MDTPSHETIARVLCKIDPSWGTRIQLAWYVHTLTDGTMREVSAREASEATGRSERTVRECFKSLAGEHNVMLRRWAAGAGGRSAYAYAINPDVGRWKNVPWLIERGDVIDDFWARVSADNSPDLPVDRARHTSGQRSVDRALHASGGVPVDRAPRARGLRPFDDVCPEVQGARSTDPLSGSPQGADNGSGAPSSSSLTGRVDPPASTRAAEVEDLAMPQDEGFNELRGLVLAAASLKEGQKVKQIWGSAERDLIGLWAVHGERAIGAAKTIPRDTGLLVPAVVKLLEQQITVPDMTDHLADPEPDQTDRAQDLAAEISRLQADVRQHESLGYDVPDAVVERLATCQNELQQITEEVAA